MPRTLLEVRRGLCLDIAEQLESTFGLVRVPSWDVDKAADLIDSHLPDTYDEAELRSKEAEEYIQETLPQREGPSLGERLREALGFHAGAPLRDVLEAAIGAALAQRAAKEE